MEKRTHERTDRVRAALPGKLLEVRSQKYFKGRPLDVSASGFSILTETILNFDDSIWLILDSSYVRLKVAYRMPDTSSRGMYRCGLEREDPGDNLLQVFDQYGCIRSIAEE